MPVNDETIPDSEHKVRRRKNDSAYESMCNCIYKLFVLIVINLYNISLLHYFYQFCSMYFYVMKFNPFIIISQI